MWERLRNWCATVEAALGLAAPKQTPTGPATFLRVCYDLSESGLPAACCRRFDLVVAPAIWHNRCDLLLSLERLLLTACARGEVTAELLVIAPREDARVRALLASRSGVSSITERAGLTVRLIDSVHGEAVEGCHPTSNGDSRGERK